MAAKKERFADPAEYKFNDKDREYYNGRFWRMPRRLVTEGVWAYLWRAEGTTRGGGAVTSILPIMAACQVPGKEWSYISRRRLAKLANLNKDTVSAAIARLVSQGYAITKTTARADGEGGFMTLYRLSDFFFPTGDEPWVKVDARMFFDGRWFMLPTPAARHLYLTFLALDPIGDAHEYVADVLSKRILAIPGGAPQGAVLEEMDTSGIDISDDIHPEWVMYLHGLYFLCLRRKRISQAELLNASGLSDRTLAITLRILSTPDWGGGKHADGVHKNPDIAWLVKLGEPHLPTYHRNHLHGIKWHWTTKFLNCQESVEQHRRDVYPFLFPAKPKPKKKFSRYD